MTTNAKPATTNIMSNTSQSNTSAQHQGDQELQRVSASQQASIGTIAMVPTFRPVTTTVTRRLDAPPPSKEQDPFLFFSNHDRRMAHLLRSDEEQIEENLPNRIADSATATVEEEHRQRITFEVHPDLMYMKYLTEEGRDLNEEADIFDLLFDYGSENEEHDH